MSDGNSLPKVGEKLQASTDDFFKRKAEALSLTQGKKVAMLKTKNKAVGFALLGAACAIYGYSMMSVKQGKLLEEFDKIVE